jgi:uncharacterized protein YndB with AHSA1/START domain
MSKDYLAKASITVDTSLEEAWDSLINPKKIKEYMFGAEVASQWKAGSKITRKGVWKGKRYVDKGEIIEVIPGEKLKYTHFSALSGLDDRPDNYHTITIKLNDSSNHVHIELTQDNNPTEEARKHSEQNWTAMLKTLKIVLERNS